MKKEVKALEKKISEAKIDVGLPLYNAICDSIETLSKEKNNENIKEVLTVMMAEFQADSVIANRTINHINDLVFSSASDQAVHTGSDCCCIRNFCMKEKNYKTTLESCSIFCSNEESMKKVCATVSLPFNSSQIVKPKYPIFELLNDPKLRSLITAGVGCDVFIDGVPGITPRVIYNFFLQRKEFTSESSYDQLLNYYGKKWESRNKNTTRTCEEIEKYKKMINTLVETYLFEPANCVNIPHDSNIYIHNTYPVSLHPYNNGFDRNDPSISIDMVDCFFYCCYCVGPGNGKHVFLRMEGVVNCFRCNRDVCSTCRFKKNRW